MGLNGFSYLDFNVKLVDPQLLLDYAAMNYFAAKTIGFTALKKEYDIWLDSAMPEETQERNLKHEVIEFSLMKFNCFTYWQAHKIATACEQYNHDWVSLFYEECKQKAEFSESFCVIRPPDQL
ncbi:MAG: hypothetical protein PHH82_00975 [Candidatus ainarchaeum sp.]|nr:hypothetical protein [Candidatus ainarchaeum sp.]